MDLWFGLVADRSFRLRLHLHTFLRGVPPRACHDAFTQSAIRFAFQLLGGLSENGFGTSNTEQDHQQPSVEPTDLDDGDVPKSFGGLLVVLGEEFSAPFCLSRDLATKAHIAGFIKQRNGELFCVLVDSEVQHDRGSPRGT